MCLDKHFYSFKSEVLYLRLFLPHEECVFPALIIFYNAMLA